MKKRFVVLLLGPHYDPKTHRATFETENQITCIRTVRTFTEAETALEALAAEGAGVVELCGALSGRNAPKR